MDVPDSPQDLLARLSQLGQWERGGRRAPHKPLLLLLLLGRLQSDGVAQASYREIEDPLRGLLNEFGPPWTTTPLYPFWYLQNDGLWEIPGAAALTQREGKPEPTVTALRASGQGRFPAAVGALLTRRPSLVVDAARTLLDRHFEPSLHEPIAAACALTLAPAERDGPLRKRDRAFRSKVLLAYEYQCAVCGWNVFVGRDPLGLEAAHLFWHALGGPDQLENGLCVCSVHHLALDRGAISVDSDRRILVSQHLTGATATDFHKLAGTPLRDPQPGNPSLGESFTLWHREQVFRAPERAVETT